MNRLRNKKGQITARVGGERFERFAVYSDAKGYKLISINGKDIFIHVFVWERVNGKKPEGHEIHHKDGDKSNYSLNNLELLSISDHRRTHAGWIKTEGKWSHKPCTKCVKVLPLEDFYPRKGCTPSARCKPCHCEATRAWALNNPEKRKKIGLDYYYRNKSTGGKNNVGE